MRYSKPQILQNLNATSTIHEIDRTSNEGKTPGLYLDHAFPVSTCTAGAYEADE
jgi:hypothetical protein